MKKDLMRGQARPALTLTLSHREREERAPALICLDDFQANTVTRLLQQRRTIPPLLGERAGVRAGVCLISLLLFSTALVQAQSYSIDWFTIDGGGGTSTGGVYSVSGTIGQPDAGRMSGGNYTLDGGFWGLVAAIQTPGAPYLFVANSGGTIIVSWLKPAEGFVLDQTLTLASPPAAISWSQVSAATYQTNATHIFITLPAPSGNNYYRLRKP